MVMFPQSNKWHVKMRNTVHIFRYEPWVSHSPLGRTWNYKPNFSFLQIPIGLVHHQKMLIHVFHLTSYSCVFLCFRQLNFEQINRKEMILYVPKERMSVWYPQFLQTRNRPYTNQHRLLCRTSLILASDIVSKDYWEVIHCIYMV